MISIARKNSKSKTAWQRLVSLAMAPMILLAAFPEAAMCFQSTGPKPSDKLLAEQISRSSLPKQVKTGSHKLIKIVPKLQFSSNPTDLELTTARLFSEPLVPMTSAVISGENSALSKALIAYKQANNVEELSQLSKFLEAFPNSRWRPSLELNMGLLRYSTGHLSKALTLWQSAWAGARHEQGSAQIAIANRAVAKLLIADARLGRMEALTQLFSEVGKRPFFGSDSEMVRGAHEGLWQMQTKPQTSFKCGPYALNSILNLSLPAPTRNPLIEKASSTKEGTNLTQVKELAQKVGLKYQIAKRLEGATAFIVPSLMHWKVGHFAALTARQGDDYIIKDPTFDHDGTLGIRGETLQEETDGYFLVPAGSLPPGWKPVDDQEGKSIWGKGVATFRDSGPAGPCGSYSGDCTVGGGCKGGAGAASGSGKGGSGMAQASFRQMLASLMITDTPVSYTPPVGPNIDFKTNYEQILPNQPSSFTFTNLGFNWRFNWISYVNIAPITLVATIITPGEGVEVSTPVAGVYPPDWITQAVFVNAGGGTYQRKLPDGSMQIYNQPDGTGNIFMTQVVNPQGNSVNIQYDANFRITTITDAINQVSTLSYVSNTVGNSGFYKVASISDPFGRTASFSYDSTNTNLLKITDVIGLQSQFVYDTSSTFITSMTNPYGTTAFEQYIPGNNGYPAAGLRTTYPDGTFTVVENWLAEPKATYYWSREATALYPSDPASKIYTHCETTEWVYEGATALEGPVMQSQKHPLENTTTFYNYPGSSHSGDWAGTSNKPTQVTRAIASQAVVATISGPVTVGDVMAIRILDGTVGGAIILYTVLTGDTSNSIAASLAALINANTVLKPINAVAILANNALTISTTSQSTTYSNYSTSSTETIGFRSIVRQTQATIIGGTVTTGDVLTLRVTKPANQGYEQFAYTVLAGDTLTTIASGLTALVNASTILQGLGITATSSGPIFTILSFSQDVQSTQTLTSGGATETFTPGTETDGAHANWNYLYNSIGKVTQAIDPINRTFSYQYAANNVDLTQITETQTGDNFLIGAWTYNSQHRPLTYEDGSGQVTHYAYNSSGQVITITDANGNITTNTYTGTSSATIGGTKTTGNVLTITVHDAGLTGGQKAINYTVLAGDTLSTIATNLAAAITADTNLQSIGVSATAVGAVITLTSTSVNVTTYTQSVVGTETITLGANNFGYLTKIDGPLSGSKDVTTQTFDAVGRVASRTDSEGLVVNYSYDNADRLVQTTYPDGTSEQIVYDRLDAVFKKDRIGRWTQDSFDVLDQLAFEIDPLGRQTQYMWCICGSLGSLTDGNGHTTTWNHDLQGRVIQKTYPDGSTVKYSYDPYLNLIRTRIDAMGQTTIYTFNPDNTPYQVGYLNAVNPTSPVTYGWDFHFKRLAAVTKTDWGSINYTYNNYIAPLGSATTGGGMLQLVHNNVIANSDITDLYDALGRTTNRSINSTSNSVTWAYDAMSRITSETNALGAFGYNYVDDVSGSSKGTMRLSSISYPNSQVTNFNWYPNIGDQRLQQITNLKTAGGALLSQFNYGYDSAGEITQWQQQQNGNNLFYNLGYDKAGQLTSAQAGSGGPQSAYANEFYYGYDAGANRTSVQISGLQTIRVGGSKTTGDVLTITVKDTALAGGQEAVSYTVLAADTLATIAQGLARAVNQDVNLQPLGVVANAHGTNTFVNIKSASNNLTTYATSASMSATETLTAGIFKNGIENAAIAGSKTTGDVLTITVKDAALAGGQEAVPYTVLAGDTLNSIATGIKTAINADAHLTALGVTATAASAVVSIASNSINATTYTSSTSALATETIALTANNNPTFLAIIGGTKTTGNILTLTAYDAALSGGQQAIGYTVLAADTLTTIATGLTTAINASTALKNIGVSATSSGAIITISSNSTNQTTLVQSYSASATESILITTAKYGWQVAALAGTKTTGDVLTITVYDASLATGKEAVNYTVLSTDTLSTIASGIAAALNADANLSAIGVTANASAAVVNLESISATLTTYAQSKSIGATETIALSSGYGVQQANYNSINELVGTAGGGAALFQGTTDKPVKSAAVSTQVLKIQSPLPAVITSYSANVAGTGTTETLTAAAAPGTASSGDGYLFSFGGTPTAGDTLSITFSDVRLLPSGSRTVSYTVLPGDTITSITGALSNAITGDPVLAPLGYAIYNLGSTQFTLTVTIKIDTQPPPVGITTSVTRPGTENISFGLTSDENTAATISGSVTTGDVVQLSVLNSRLAGGQENLSHTVTGGETTSTIATALATAINADANLQTIGIGATSSGAVLTLDAYTYFTTSVGAGTETLTVSNANRGSVAITIGGVAKTGDVLSITAHDAALAGGQETVSYTVLSTDTLLSISQALATAINVDTHLQALGVTTNNSVALTTSELFSGNALLPAGKSAVATSAVDGSNNTKSNGYALSVNGGSTTNLTFDLNGNMTSDGTNSYLWDAENRMIKITYPGTNNFSSFIYDGLSRNVSIVETTAGSVTSTKQFVWSFGAKPREARDGTGTLVSQYFGIGQLNVSTKYPYELNHLGSVVGMTDNSGTKVSDRSYDPFGRATINSETVAPDFGYAGYYLHARSGLNLTRTRAYSSAQGRFINRDPIEEEGGVNLYDYVANNPVMGSDPDGTAMTGMYLTPQWWINFWNWLKKKCRGGGAPPPPPPGGGPPPTTGGQPPEDGIGPSGGGAPPPRTDGKPPEIEFNRKLMEEYRKQLEKNYRGPSAPNSPNEPPLSPD